MEQLGLFEAAPPWTVGALTRHLRQLFEQDPALKGVWVQGEISNLSRPASGHVYFTLKDSTAALRCVMWKSDAIRMRFKPEDGQAVEAHGSIGIYEVSGQYQLYTDALRPIGEGALYQEFLRLKALLEAEGLFDVSRKRLIPELPRRIGIVTSATGAALHDMLQTLQRRLPLVQVVLAPTPVQGAEAPAALVSAIQRLNTLVKPDVILIARGGGSMEDLWAFNDEGVVRAVAASQAPVISGVGHETDFTLVDFAADLRAPTPTAAAELATPVTVEALHETLVELAHILQGDLQALFEARHASLDNQRTDLRYNSPLRRVQIERQRLDEVTRWCNSLQAHRIELDVARLKGLGNRLGALSPLAVLQRGYALVTKNSGVVSSRAQVTQGDHLKVHLRDGEFNAQVTGDE